MRFQVFTGSSTCPRAGTMLTDGYEYAWAQFKIHTVYGILAEVWELIVQVLLRTRHAL
jgi:hypothetical protein